MKPIAALLIAAAQAVAAPAVAQMHGDHAAHMSAGAGAVPSLPGNDIFGAITEIVALLSADRATDWSRVSIDALRDHLLDMDAVARGPAPETRVVDGGIEMRILTTGPAGEAAARMVPAHSVIMETETNWLSSVDASVTGTLVWRVTRSRPEDGLVIRGLGFFGLLATGAHHPAHHLAMAKGSNH